MSKQKDYEERTERLILPVLEPLGFELVDVEYVKEGSDYILRAYIDKPGGITINDCVDVSRTMNEILDREDFVEDAYIFEVSSPGLGRPLKKDKDFDRNIGLDVDIKTYKPINGAKEFCGKLTNYTDTTVTIEFEDGVVDFNRSDIALIRQSLDF